MRVRARARVKPGGVSPFPTFCQLSYTLVCRMNARVRRGHGRKRTQQGSGNVSFRRDPLLWYVGLSTSHYLFSVEFLAVARVPRGTHLTEETLASGCAALREAYPFCRYKFRGCWPITASPLNIGTWERFHAIVPSRPS